MTRHQYGFSALVPQTVFRGETSGGVAKYRLSQVRFFWQTSCIIQGVVYSQWYQCDSDFYDFMLSVVICNWTARIERKRHFRAPQTRSPEWIFFLNDGLTFSYGRTSCLVSRPHYSTAYGSRVTCSERVFFVSDTSPKCIDREGLKRRGSGTRQ